MYHIIINPVGGKGESQKALQTVKKLLDAKKVPYIVHETQHAPRNRNRKGTFA